MSSFSEIAQKKIAGVPVLYLAGAAVVVLAVVAWRMKPSTDAPEESPTDGGTDAELDDNGHAVPGNPYGGYSGTGTVIVAPAPPPAEEKEDHRAGSNDEWVRQGAEWLVAEKKVNGQAAYVALNKYVSGQSRSYQESGWVDQVIAAKGLPPESFSGTPPTTTNPPPPSATPPVALKAVTGLRVAWKTGTHVNLDWNPAAGAIGYWLYRDGKTHSNPVIYSAGTLGELQRNTQYTLGVAAIYPGNKVGPRATVNVRTNAK